jgi:hypothetical protein
MVDRVVYKNVRKQLKSPRNPCLQSLQGILPVLHWYNFCVPTPFHRRCRTAFFPQGTLLVGIKIFTKAQTSFLEGVTPDGQVVSCQEWEEAHVFETAICYLTIRRAA